MNKKREETLQNLKEYWKYLIIIHHSKMMKRKRVTELFNSIPTLEMKRQFILGYVMRDCGFIYGNSFEKDEDFMIQVLRNKKGKIFFQGDLWKAKTFVSKAVKYYRDALKFALCTIDSEIISSSLEFKPNSLQHCKRGIRNDKEIVMKSLGKNYGTIMFVGESLLDDIDILRKCLSKSKNLKTLKYSMTETLLMKEIVKR
ncbi:predicted protein [Naegleria gruberi]|uniref:Predicted protein n=1 Tax=Naegleria gruberi TaxID=5762 RepID=D2VPH6_NAEGR|nr:uncharacterized protein NAEGRDRAFT_70863 [Naegleria gruberi]EFC41208.1 predicted protein [Naegleria gruberi]|eukprot:XP_002673952.1 predicted protein [Naegleria gruberi strain NEG-M]